MTFGSGQILLTCQFQRFLYQTLSIFFEHGHVAFQINKDDRQNRMQVTFLSKGQTGDLRVRSNIINMSISKIFIPNFVCVITNKR